MFKMKKEVKIEKLMIECIMFSIDECWHKMKEDINSYEAKNLSEAILKLSEAYKNIACD